MIRNCGLSREATEALKIENVRTSNFHLEDKMDEIGSFEILRCQEVQKWDISNVEEQKKWGFQRKTEEFQRVSWKNESDIENWQYQLIIIDDSAFFNKKLTDITQFFFFKRTGDVFFLITHKNRQFLLKISEITIFSRKYWNFLPNRKDFIVIQLKFLLKITPPNCQMVLKKHWNLKSQLILYRICQLENNISQSVQISSKIERFSYKWHGNRYLWQRK